MEDDRNPASLQRAAIATPRESAAIAQSQEPCHHPAVSLFLPQHGSPANGPELTAHLPLLYSRAYREEGQQLRWLPFLVDAGDCRRQ